MPITIPLADPKLFGQRLEDAAQEKASFDALPMHNEGSLQRFFLAF